ncbi:MAG TPA: class I SAM-dependent methyltransferase, partial [Acidimicrobiales bacterium]
YEQTDVARRYAQGRSLPDSVLERWRATVIPLVPSRGGLVVLDVGAGTGIFSRAWPSWFPARVVAVEPAPAMRAEMLRHGVSASVQVVAGRGEQLPLNQACVDVVWLSAVIHHLDDLARCAAEIRRVLAADGTVLVRGLFADLGRAPGLELIPGSERALAAFPNVATIEGAFARHGLRLASTGTVEDAGPATIGQAADRVRRLRHADTLLIQFTDDEIAEGLAAMDALDPAQSLEPASLGLLAFGP